MNPRTVIAVDIGYGNTKVVWSHTLDRQGKSRWGEICFRSITPPVVVDEESTGIASNPDRVLIELNGQSYYAGPAATMGVEARALDPNYIETDQHEVLLRVAIHLAMRELGRFTSEIDMLVLGLPVSGFTSRGSRLNEIALQPRQIDNQIEGAHHGGNQQAFQRLDLSPHIAHKARECFRGGLNR